jgi:hypothetical protein
MLRSSSLEAPLFEKLPSFGDQQRLEAQGHKPHDHFFETVTDAIDNRSIKESGVALQATLNPRIVQAIPPNENAPLPGRCRNV